MVSTGGASNRSLGGVAVRETDDVSKARHVVRIAGQLVGGCITSLYLIAVGIAIGLDPVASLLVAGLMPMVVAAGIDIYTYRLPDVLVAQGASVVLFGALWPGFAIPLVGPLVGAAVGALPLLAVHLVAPAALGFGDVKAMGVLGGLIGFVDWPSVLLALVLATGGSAVAGIIRRHKVVPLGPGLVAGSLIAVIVGMW